MSPARHARWACSHCSRTVRAPRDADACPHCGASRPRLDVPAGAGRRGASLMAALLGGSIAACTPGAGDAPANDAAAEQATEAAAQAAADAERLARVAEALDEAREAIVFSAARAALATEKERKNRLLAALGEPSDPAPDKVTLPSAEDAMASADPPARRRDRDQPAQTRPPERPSPDRILVQAYGGAPDRLGQNPSRFQPGAPQVSNIQPRGALSSTDEQNIQRGLRQAFRRTFARLAAEGSAGTTYRVTMQVTVDGTRGSVSSAQVGTVAPRDGQHAAIAQAAQSMRGMRVVPPEGISADQITMTVTVDLTVR